MPSDCQQKQSDARMREESDLSLEVVVLLIFGVFWLLFGLLLFKIYSGDLPYNPDSTYGLFLVIVSFQMITMGKTPFGDLRRSWALVVIGIGTAILGIATCFTPGYFTKFVRILVGIVLFAGGIALFVQLCISERKAKMWIKIAGILRQLTIACALVYALTIISGLITLFPGLRTDPRTAILVMFYGMSFFYLSWCVWKVGRTYAPEKPDDSASTIRSSDRADSQGRFSLFREASLPLSLAILILSGFNTTLLGLLLFPVSLDMLPFSPDGQLGLLLTIMAIQMMTLGDTPLGQYTRSWFMIIIGIVFAGLGAVSCIVPGMLTGMIQILLGLLNIMGGAAFFIKRFLAKLHEIRTPLEAPIVVPPIVRRLTVTQMVVNSMTIAFGISMLLPGLVPGLVAAGILVITGLVLFILASLMQKVARMQASGEQQVI
ncbi:MAG: hypothetical protein ACLQPD_14210 [Desulfomonilaceae bacterium]